MMVRSAPLAFFPLSTLSVFTASESLHDLYEAADNGWCSFMLLRRRMGRKSLITASSAAAAAPAAAAVCPGTGSAPALTREFTVSFQISQLTGVVTRSLTLPVLTTLIRW